MSIFFSWKFNGKGKKKKKTRTFLGLSKWRRIWGPEVYIQTGNTANYLIKMQPNGPSFNGVLSKGNLNHPVRFVASESSGGKFHSLALCYFTSHAIGSKVPDSEQGIIIMIHKKILRLQFFLCRYLSDYICPKGIMTTSHAVVNNRG